jgi:hypothetical protein
MSPSNLPTANMSTKFRKFPLHLTHHDSPRQADTQDDLMSYVVKKSPKINPFLSKLTQNLNGVKK